MAFAVVLPREGFAAHCADKGPLVGVGAEMRAEVVSACEFLGAESALERRGVFLHALCAVGCDVGRPVWVCKVEDAVAMRY